MRCLQGLDNVSQVLDEACPDTLEEQVGLNWMRGKAVAFMMCQEIRKDLIVRNGRMAKNISI